MILENSAVTLVLRFSIDFKSTAFSLIEFFFKNLKYYHNLFVAFQFLGRMSSTFIRVSSRETAFIIPGTQLFLNNNDSNFLTTISL